MALRGCSVCIKRIEIPADVSGPKPCAVVDTRTVTLSSIIPGCGAGQVRQRLGPVWIYCWLCIVIRNDLWLGLRHHAWFGRGVGFGRYAWLGVSLRHDRGRWLWRHAWLGGGVGFWRYAWLGVSLRHDRGRWLWRHTYIRCNSWPKAFVMLRLSVRTMTMVNVYFDLDLRIGVIGHIDNRFGYGRQHWNGRPR